MADDASHNDPTDRDPDIRAALERVQLSLSSDLFRLREDVGWSQEQLARAASVGPNTILRLEQGRANPTIETLVRAFYALGYLVDVRPLRPPPMVGNLSRPL